MGGSPKAPKDYTEDKAGIALATADRYKGEAHSWNAKTRMANRQLDGFRRNFDAKDWDFSAVDAWDNPDTKRNEARKFGRARDFYESGLSDLRSLAPVDDAPVFKSLVNSEYGDVGVHDIPTLKNFNQAGYDTLLSDFEGALAGLGRIETERDDELARIDDARDRFRGEADGLSAMLKRSSIGDDASFALMGDTLTQMRTGLKNFDSDFLDAGMSFAPPGAAPLAAHRPLWRVLGPDRRRAGAHRRVRAVALRPGRALLEPSWTGSGSTTSSAPRAWTGAWRA